MTETKVICDRCKQVIIESRTLLRVESGSVRDVNGLETVDMCKDCGERFAEFMRSNEQEGFRLQRTG